MKQSGFFDVEERLARLSGLGDQLEAFSRTVDFEVFRSDLNKASGLFRRKQRRTSCVWSGADVQDGGFLKPHFSNSNPSYFNAGWLFELSELWACGIAAILTVDLRLG